MVNTGMSNVTLMALMLGVSLLSVAQASEPVALTDPVVSLENFEQDPPNTFPREWKVRGSDEEAHQVYRIAEENGNHFLHAYAEKQEVQIGLTKAFPPKQFPLLQWRWRVEKFPVGADERASATNDSAAGVYVVFDSSLIPRVIKYVWSASLPKGTEFNSPIYWRAKVVVLESGGPGEWKQEAVNFYEDYKKLFGSEPREAEGVALLTDADSTGTVAEADYDDFTLLKADAASTVRVTGAAASVGKP